MLCWKILKAAACNPQTFKQLWAGCLHQSSWLGARRSGTESLQPSSAKVRSSWHGHDLFSPVRGAPGTLVWRRPLPAKLFLLLQSRPRASWAPIRTICCPRSGERPQSDPAPGRRAGAAGRPGAPLTGPVLGSPAGETPRGFLRGSCRGAIQALNCLGEPSVMLQRVSQGEGHPCLVSRALFFFLNFSNWGTGSVQDYINFRSTTQWSTIFKAYAPLTVIIKYWLYSLCCTIHSLVACLFYAL